MTVPSLHEGSLHKQKCRSAARVTRWGIVGETKCAVESKTSASDQLSGGSPTRKNAPLHSSGFHGRICLATISLSASRVLGTAFLLVGVILMQRKAQS